MRPHVVSHLNAKATQLALGGIYFSQEKSRNVQPRKSNLRRISQAKSERVRRTWIPPTSLLTPKREILKSLILSELSGRILSAIFGTRA